MPLGNYPKRPPAEELKRRRVRAQQLQERMKKRDWSDDKDRRALVKSIVENRKRLDDLEALAAVESGVREANDAE